MANPADISWMALVDVVMGLPGFPHAGKRGIARTMKRAMADVDVEEHDPA